MIQRFTKSSTRSSSSGFRGSGWVKSKRSLSGATRLPAWRTWGPRTALNAAWRRWVAVWFRSVSRLLGSTTARTLSPTLSTPSSTRALWRKIPRSVFLVVSTRARPPGHSKRPKSPICPPPSA